MKYYKSKKYPIELVVAENLENEYELHNHTKHLILTIVLQGMIEIEIEGTSKKYNEGEWYYILPFCPHRLLLNKAARLLTVCIEKSYMEKSELCDLQNNLISCLKRLCSDYDISERQIIAFYRFINDSLIKCNAIGKVRNRTYTQQSEDIYTIFSIMAERPEQAYPLDDLAKRFFISKYQLIKKFKREVGMSPHRFQVQSRIRKAQKMIMDEILIADISAELGFYDQSHFDKTFHKIVGISPIEYSHSVKIIE